MILHDRLRREFTRAQRVINSFARKRLDYPRGIADQKQAVRALDDSARRVSGVIVRQTVIARDSKSRFRPASSSCAIELGSLTRQRFSSPFPTGAWPE